jgi:hypothetical protein
MSGWIELAMSEREEYREMFKRECTCHLIGKEIQSEIGMYYTNRIGADGEMEILEEIRKRRRG